jgi:hypothetical protein
MVRGAAMASPRDLAAYWTAVARMPIIQITRLRRTETLPRNLRFTPAQRHSRHTLSS